MIPTTKVNSKHMGAKQIYMYMTLFEPTMKGKAIVQ